MPEQAAELDAPRRPWLLRLAVAGAVFLTGSTISGWASDLIAADFPERPQPADLLLRNLPYLPSVGRLVDLFAVIATLLVLAHYARKRFDEIPEAVALFGFAVLLRSIAVPLTPLASPHAGMVSTGVFAGSQGLFPGQNGMFPSGHSANVLMCYLLIDGEQDPWLRGTALVLCVAEWVALLLSRMHYSIDIVGGLLIAYFVFTEWKRGRLFDPIKRLVV